jgi:hypothetical protein
MYTYQEIRYIGISMPTNRGSRLTTREAAAAAEVALITLNRWIAKGKIRAPSPFLVGARGMRLWGPADVERIRAHKMKHFRKGRGRKKQTQKED